MKKKTLAKAKTFLADNHDKLVKEAEEVMKARHVHPRRRAIGSITYYLVDLDGLDDMYGEALTDDEKMELAEADMNVAGDIDIWIEAAKNLGFDDYVKSLEDLRDEGP